MSRMTYAPGLLAVVLALGVSACGSKDKETTATAPTAAPTTAATDTPTPAATETADADKDAGGDPDNGADAGESADAKDKDCGDAGDIDGKPKTAPPSNLQVVSGAKVYKSVGPIGKTTQFFAARDADPDDLVQQRDQVADALVEGGYKLLNTDQEEGSEAEAHLSGPHAVDVQVVYLCKGKVRIRYTVS
jgi:hypothetical protein